MQPGRSSNFPPVYCLRKQPALDEIPAAHPTPRVSDLSTTYDALLFVPNITLAFYLAELLLTKQTSTTLEASLGGWRLAAMLWTSDGEAL